MVDYYEELMKFKPIMLEEPDEEDLELEEKNEWARRYNLALSYAKQGSEDLSKIQLNKVVYLKPDCIDARLLYALLCMKTGENTEAQKEIETILSIDADNVTAQKYLGELTGILPRKSGKPTVEVIPREEYKVKPIDHYEDPDKERWKQLIYLLIGAGLGILAMIVLVLPSVRSGASVDYNTLKKEYDQTVQAKDSKIEELESQVEADQKEKEELEEQLGVYEGDDGEDSMYDKILKASKAYTEGDYVTCVDYIKDVKKDVLPSDTAKDIYESMIKDVYDKAAEQLFDEGQDSYESYDYESALASFKQSYEYKESYSTKYYLAMCYKRTGDTDTANKYFYDIINNSGDSDLIQQAANNGLELTINDARVAAGQDPVDVYGYDPDAEDSDDSDYDEESYSDDDDDSSDEEYDEDEEE